MVPASLHFQVLEPKVEGERYCDAKEQDPHTDSYILGESSPSFVEAEGSLFLPEIPAGSSLSRFQGQTGS